MKERRYHNTKCNVHITSLRFRYWDWGSRFVFKSDNDPQISTQTCVFCKDVLFTRKFATSFIYITTVVKCVSLFLARCNGYLFQRYKSAFIYKITLNRVYISFLHHFNYHHSLRRWNVLREYEEFYKFSTLNGKFVFCHFLHFLFLPFLH